MTIHISIQPIIGLGYTKHSVVNRYHENNELTRETKHVYNTFLFLFIKFFWVTGDSLNTNINISPRTVVETKESPWVHKLN
jgi:hypothetical protein